MSKNFKVAALGVVLHMRCATLGLVNLTLDPVKLCQLLFQLASARAASLRTRYASRCISASRINIFLEAPLKKMLFEEEAAIIAGSFAACLLLTLFLGAYLAELFPSCSCGCRCGECGECDESIWVEWFCLRFCPLRGANVRRLLEEDIALAKDADLHSIIDRSNELCAAAKAENATRQTKAEAKLALQHAIESIERLPQRDRAAWVNLLKP